MTLEEIRRVIDDHINMSKMGRHPCGVEYTVRPIGLDDWCVGYTIVFGDCLCYIHVIKSEGNKTVLIARNGECVAYPENVRELSLALKCVMV